VRAEYRKVADAHARGQADKARLSLEKARANALAIDWAAYNPPRPSFFGARVLDDWDLADLARHIDWTPFFQTWSSRAAIPPFSTTRNKARGAAIVRRRAGDAETHHHREMVRAQGGGRLLACGAGWRRHPPLADDGRETSLATLFTLRQQLAKRDGAPMSRSPISSRRSTAADKTMSAPSW